MGYLKFDEKDVEYLVQVMGISEDEASDILDKAESMITSLNKDDVLDLFVLPPERWEDFVGSIDVSVWMFDKEYVEFLYIEHDFGEEIGIVVADVRDDEDFSYIGELPDGEIVHFGEFAKVDAIGNVYCAVERSKRIRTGDVYVPIYWSSNKRDVIEFVKDYLKELEEDFRIEI
jgi:hypothetical protein